MIIDRIKEARKLEKARQRPFLPLVGFPLVENLQAIRQRLFPRVTVPVGFYFVDRGPLACISHWDSGAIIYVHQILNHGEVPPVVWDLIFVHELLHLEIPPRVVGGRRTKHPPEFRDREKELFPERKEAWEWIGRNLWSFLKLRPRLERIDVLPHWKNRWLDPDAFRWIHKDAERRRERLCESNW